MIHPYSISYFPSNITFAHGTIVDKSLCDKSPIVAITVTTIKAIVSIAFAILLASCRFILKSEMYSRYAFMLPLTFRFFRAIVLFQQKTLGTCPRVLINLSNILYYYGLNCAIRHYIRETFYVSPI